VVAKPRTENMTLEHEQNPEQQAQTESLPQVIYRAVGWVAGIYKPGPEKIYQGVFVTEDGLTLPAQLTRQFQSRLKRKHQDYATQADLFNKPAKWTVYPKTEPLGFDLTMMKPLKSDAVDGPGQLDHFRVVGLIESALEGAVAVRIQRNPQPLKLEHRPRAFKPKAFVLNLEGILPTEAVEQIWNLEVRREGEKLVVLAGRPYEPDAEDLAWLAHVNQQSTVEQVSVASPTTDKSVNNLASVITPQPQQPMSQDNSEPSSATEPQSSPPVPAQIMQPEAKPKLELPQMPPAVANPTERFQHQVKQQRPSKTSPSQGQKQQLSDVPPESQRLRPPDLLKKQPTSESQTSQPLKKSRFRVNVNGRLFEGFESVTLNKRIVRVDGVNVGQAKMVIVLGQPLSMQADGGVSQGGNQAVLTSR